MPINVNCKSGWILLNVTGGSPAVVKPQMKWRLKAAFSRNFDRNLS
jgi:hypothetical protein